VCYVFFFFYRPISAEDRCYSHFLLCFATSPLQSLWFNKTELHPPTTVRADST
jgi:hypothetical protein